MHRIARIAAGGLAAIVGLSATIISTAPAEALTASQVRTAQTRLNYLGCNAGPVDGAVGMMTKAATVRFQAVMKIKQTGTLDAPTYWRLGVSWRKRCDKRAVPSPSGSGRRLVISQSQNWLWVIDSSSHVIAQGGIIDNPSVYGPGTYYTGSKCGKPARIKNNSDGGSLILHNFVRYAPCGGGFHQIPTYRSSGAQIHADYLLGTNYKQSHGCIRVSKAMSDVLWNFAASRTKLVILR